MYTRNDVSVIIPTYNRPNYLMRAVDSVCAQSVPPNELIVVNDGSDRSYTEQRKKIRELSIDTLYVETDGIGAGGARNMGADKSSNDILMFLDDDDIWSEKKVENQLELLDRQVELVYSGRVVVDESGFELYSIDPTASGDLSEKIIIHNPIGTTSTSAVVASLFDSVGGFDERMPALQDWELWIRLCQETQVDFDPDYTVQWTSHQDAGDQITSQVERYIKALELIKTKHSSLFRSLGWKKKRKARAYRNKAVAKRYAQAGSRKKYPYIFKSLFNWPTIAAAGRLLPEETVTRVRKST